MSNTLYEHNGSKRSVAEVEAALVALFGLCGALESVRVQQSSKDHRKFMGYAFLTFVDAAAVARAVLHNGAHLLGQPIKVDANPSYRDRYSLTP
jgi:hypothetical protein